MGSLRRTEIDRVVRLSLAVVVTVAGWLMPASGAADDGADPTQEAPLVSVLHLGSPLLESWQGQTLPEGQWSVSLATAYFNTWHYTWHIGSVHRHLGLRGTALTRATTNVLEEFYPHEAAHQVDVEGWRTDLVVSLGLGSGWTAAVNLPWVGIGSPSWDVVPESFHELIGAKGQRRDWFPRGQSVIYIKSGQRSVLIDRLDGSGVGDVGLSVGRRLGEWRGGVHRLAAHVETPTGDGETLQGSDGWDLGVRYFADWQLRSWRIGVGAGYTWLDSSGAWLGLERDDLWHLRLHAGLETSRMTRWSAVLRADSSPVDGFGEVSDPTVVLQLGVQRPLTDTVSWWVVIGEDAGGVAADFTLQAGVGFTL